MTAAESWGRIRQPTALRLAKAQSVQPVLTGAAWASIISRARPFANLGDEDKSEVEQWAANGGSRIPVEDYEVSAVSNATIAEEGFNGDKRNARKGVARLLNTGIIDRVSQGRRGHASLYVTYPTLADVAEGAYTAPHIEQSPIVESPNRAYAGVRPIGVAESSNRAYVRADKAYRRVRPNATVENSNRAYDRTKKGVRQSEKGRMGVGSDQGFQKHHQSNTTDIHNRSGRSVAAAAEAAPPARKRNGQPTSPCPLCGGKLFRNTQTGNADCSICFTSFPKDKVTWD